MRFKDLYLKESSFGLNEYRDAISMILNQLSVDLETIKKKVAKHHSTWNITHEKNKKNDIDSVKNEIKKYNYRLKNSKSVDEKTLKLWIDEFHKEYNYK